MIDWQTEKKRGPFKATQPAKAGLKLRPQDPSSLFFLNHAALLRALHMFHLDNPGDLFPPASPPPLAPTPPLKVTLRWMLAVDSDNRDLCL